MTDEFDYNQLSPGIRETVRWLRERDFETTDSGDGVTNVALGIEGAFAVPMVAMHIEDADLLEEANYLWSLLGDLLGQAPARCGVQVEASYDPADGSAILLLTGLDDRMLQSARKCGCGSGRDKDNCPNGV